MSKYCQNLSVRLLVLFLKMLRKLFTCTCLGIFRNAPISRALSWQLIRIIIKCYCGKKNKVCIKIDLNNIYFHEIIAKMLPYVINECNQQIKYVISCVIVVQKTAICRTHFKNCCTIYFEAALWNVEILYN